MVFAHGFPVQAMPGNFLGEHEHAPLPVCRRIKQGFWRYAIPFDPPGIDLEQTNVERFSRRLCLPDNYYGLLPGGRIVSCTRNINSKRLHTGFLSADSVQQGCGHNFGFHRKDWKSKNQQQCNHSFHVFRLLFYVERSE